jgi:hypothetical protein
MKRRGASGDGREESFVMSVYDVGENRLEIAERRRGWT